MCQSCLREGCGQSARFNAFNANPEYAPHCPSKQPLSIQDMAIAKTVYCFLTKTNKFVSFCIGQGTLRRRILELCSNCAARICQTLCEQPNCLALQNVCLSLRKNATIKAGRSSFMVLKCSEILSKREQKPWTKSQVLGKAL